MIRLIALMVGSVVLLASTAVAQVTYVSQVRNVEASVGLPGGSLFSSAPGLGDWVDGVAGSGPFGFASASQNSSLGSWRASITLAVSATSTAYARSNCDFQFVPTQAMSVRIVGNGRGNLSTFSLIGPGVAISRTAGGAGTNWDVSADLQAGQTYAFASSLEENETTDADPLELTLTFAIQPTPQGRSFSYQGLVRDALGQPISTPSDMEFRLFVHPTLEGTQVGPTLTASGIVPDKGVFTRLLDFGDVFDGDTLWLEVSVRNPAGGGTFTPVLPRTPIASVPYASHALRASTATHAATADTATNATFATNANTAITAPWSGLTGPAGVTTGSVGGGWQFLLNNIAVTNFRGGVRLADSGFLEITNVAQLANPNFARLSSSGTWSAVSDARLKTDVTREDPAALLDAALKLSPVRFVWKSTGAADSGLLAQEVRAVMPELVTGSEEGGLLTVDYSKVGVIAVGAVQAQQVEIRLLRERVSKAEAENADLRARLEKLERLLDRR